MDINRFTESLARVKGVPTPVVLRGRQIIEQVGDHAMFLIDRHGRAASWNEGVGAILGWTEDEWLGQPVAVAFTPEDASAGVPEHELASAAETGRADDDRWMLRRNGERFFAVGSVTRLRDDAGELAGFLKVLRDFTSSQRADDECTDLLASERSARSDAERQAAVLTAAIDAMPDGVYIGTADGISRCNAPALAMLGVSSLEQLQGDPDENARRFRIRDRSDGPLIDTADLPFARALAGERSVLEAWVTKLSTGEDVFIRGTASPIRIDGRIVGAVAVNRDLTEHRRLQQQSQELQRVETVLKERDEQLHALVVGVRDYAIFTIDLDGKISSWHEGAALMKGYSADEAIGMEFANLFTPEQRDAGQPAHEMEIAARSGEYKGEGPRLRKDGSIFEAAVVLTALHGPHGELLGYLKLTQDITERKRQEREREEMRRADRAARADAERASLAKDEFLATISHELRTPLSAILGWAAVLERGVADEEGLRKGLAAIIRNARVQVQLIEDLLDMNRIESGQLRLEMQPVDVAGVVAGAVDAVLPLAANKGVSLRTVLDPTAERVRGDPARLQQIVWNLLSNAIKFTPAGGRITVSVECSGGLLEIGVADTGQGINPDALGRIFDRFQQEDAGTTRRHGGLGIGLAIVRQLSQLHGGSVRADSAGLGQGAVFTVTLPTLGGLDGMPRVVAVGEPLPPRAELPTGEQPLAGATVLLIDDEPDARAIAEHVLRGAGAQVLCASSAREGFDLFRQHRPTAILSDIGMPVHDGYDFVRWVRSLAPDEGGDTPAAAFTAFARPEDKRRALAAGFQSHLAKPVEPAKLLAAVVTLIPH